jgi:hypothetical protein
MTAHAGDALSHVDFQGRPQALSHLIGRSEIAPRKQAGRPAPRRNLTGSAHICIGAMSQSV